MRPHDWHVLDLPGDPTPGDPWGVRSLSARLGSVGDDAADAERGMRSLAGDNAVLSWVGLAGDVFRGAIDDLPGQLHKLADSYHRCSSALSRWAEDLEGVQEQADRALVKGRAARTRLDALQGQLSAAQGSLSSASSSYDRLHNPPAGGTSPDPAQVSAALRSQQAAQSQVSGLSAQVGDAQQELDLAKRLARDAAQVRDGAADRAKSRIDDAADAGIHNDSFWHHLGDAVSKVWHVVVTIAKVVVVVLGVIALIIGGPLAWVVFAAALVLLADALMKYANGEGSLWDVGFALLGCIPGTKGLTTLGELSAAFRAGGMLGAGGHLLGAGRTALAGMAASVRELGGAARTVVRGLPGALKDLHVVSAVTPEGVRIPVGLDTSSLKMLLNEARGGGAGGGGRWADPEVRQKWVDDILSDPTRVKPENHQADWASYQRQHAGKDTVLLGDGAPEDQIWADGIHVDPDTVVAMEAKFVVNPSASAYQGDFPEFMLRDFDDEMGRYKGVLAEGENPVTRLRIVTNTARAADFLEARARGILGPDVDLVVKVLP